MTTLPPAPRPCSSCPYRQDVPSGVWDEGEYAKLAAYDGPTYSQPPRLFQCHQRDRTSDQVRVCSGWAGCHDTEELLGVRIALVAGRITSETAEAIRSYTSPVPLFKSGTEAAAHGMRDIEDPGYDALLAMRKIRRTRTDLT